MRFTFRVSAVGLLLAGAVTGCSTPQKRAHERGTAFHRLSPADQRLVLHGHVRPGLSQEGVYIAWGAPDQKTINTGGKGGRPMETWIYRQRVTITEPQNSYDYFGPYQGDIDLSPVSPPYPSFVLGRLGNEAFLRFQPHVRSLDILRVAEFREGKVDRFKSN